MQQKQQNHSPSPQRENRVAEALRENLRKRKIQQQTRAATNKQKETQ